MSAWTPCGCKAGLAECPQRLQKKHSWEQAEGRDTPASPLPRVLLGLVLLPLLLWVFSVTQPTSGCRTGFQRRSQHWRSEAAAICQPLLRWHRGPLVVSGFEVKRTAWVEATRSAIHTPLSFSPGRCGLSFLSVLQVNFCWWPA